MSSPSRDSYRPALISILTDNEPGVLARVAGLFTGRGYNIDSLTVAAVGDRLARFTITTHGTDMVIEHIKSLLDRLVPVHRVAELSVKRPHLVREMALIKIGCAGKRRLEILQLAVSFGGTFTAQPLEAAPTYSILEVNGNAGQIDNFLASIGPSEIIEVIRTGVAAIACGPSLT